MTSNNNIFQEILADIIPTADELYIINEIVEVTSVLLKNTAKELDIEYTIIEPQGSTGIKQTQLRNDFDIDLFVGLSYKKFKHKYEGLSRNKLKKESKKDFLKLCHKWIIKSLTLKEFSEPRLLYAEHPYVTVDFVDQDKEIKVKLDIVLYFDLPLEYIKKFGPVTAVDRSPWHGRFVRDNLNKNQKDDVRLLKQFFKSCHSYGDKSAVGKIGFIGYSAELLIYHFKTIHEVFKNFNSLPETPLDYHGRPPQELKKIEHFKNEYLIITDPVDSNRNVGSAISKRAHKYCNQKIQDFLNNPSLEFFKFKSIPEADLSKLDNFFVIETINNNPEVHYTINRDKLYALGEKIKSNGEKEFSHEERFGTIEFEVYFEDEINEYNIALYCEKSVISDSYLRKGPPIKEKTHSSKFKKKNPNYIEKENFLWSESKRKYVDFLVFLQDFVRDNIPDNLGIVNISKASETKNSTGKKVLYVLKNMVLPFIKTT